MSRKTIAIIVEAIPLVSIVVFLASVFSYCHDSGDPGLVRNTSDLSIVCHSDLQLRIMILSWKPSFRAYIALNDLCIQLIKPCSFFHEEQGFFQGRDRRATL